MDSESEFSDRKRCREENPKAFSSPEQNNKKKSRKKKNKGSRNPEDPHSKELNAEDPRFLPEVELPQVCPQHEPMPPLVVDTETLIVHEKKQGAESEPNEEHPVPELTPQKRKWERKKKNVLNHQGEEEPKELVDAAISIESEQKKNVKEKWSESSEGNAAQLQVCSKHELSPPLDASIPIVPEQRKGVEPNENTGCHKREPNEPVDSAIPIDPEKRKGAGNEAGAEQPEPIHAPEATPQKRKWESKKNTVLNLQGSELKNTKGKGAEPNEANVEQHQVCSKHEPAPPLDATIPIVSEKKKGAVVSETNGEQPQVCTKLVPEKKGGAESIETSSKYELVIPIDSEKKKGAGPCEDPAEHPELIPVPDPTPPKDTPQKKKWERKKKNVLSCQGAEAEPKEPDSELPPLCSPLDPAIPIGLELKITKEKGTEPNEASVEQRQVCPEHEPPIPTVLEKKEGAESNETSSKHEPVTPIDSEKKNVVGPSGAPAEHLELLSLPDPTPPKDTSQKKKWVRKKQNALNCQGAEPKEPNNADHPQLCSPLGSELKNKKIKEAEPNEANAEHPQVSPKPEPAPPLDTAIPIDPEKKKGTEPTEANAENPQVCPKPESATPVDMAIPINPEKKKEAEPSEAQAEHPKPQPCSKPDPAPPTTPLEQSRRKKRKRRGRKSIMCSAEMVGNQRNLLQNTLNHSLNQTQPEKNGTEPTEANAENPQVCPKPESAPPVDTAIPVSPEKKKEAEPSEAQAEHPQPQPFSKPDPAPPGDPKTPVEQSRRKKRKRRGRKSIICSAEMMGNQRNVLQNTLNHALNQTQPEKKGTEPTEADAENPQVCPKPESAPPVDTAIPVNPEKKNEAEPSEAQAEHPKLRPQPCSKPDPAPLGDPTILLEQSRRKKRKRRGRKGKMCSDEMVGNQRNLLQNTLNHAVNQTQLEKKGTEPTEANAVNPQVCAKPELTPPVDTTIPVNPEKKKEAEPSEAHAEHSQPQPQPCSKPDPAPPGDPATPVEQSRRKQRNRRRRKSIICSDEMVGNQRNLLQNTLNHAVNQNQPIPVDPAIPTDPEQKSTKKKRKKRRKSVLTTEGAEPKEHNGKPPVTPVQRSICHIEAPPIDPTIPIDQTISIDPDPATPIDPEQKMTKKKMKKRKSALKSEGSEPEKPSAEPMAGSLVQRTTALTVTKVPFNWPGESSKSKYNAEPRSKTPVQRTEGLKVTEVPLKWHGESSMRCRACQQLGHKFEDCPRLKYLSRDEEICFFCGEIGHSLGKCSVSQAGGGRFAKCLFCYAHGHFSNKCPRNGHGIDPEVVAANGPINNGSTAAGFGPSASVSTTAPTVAISTPSGSVSAPRNRSITRSVSNSRRPSSRPVTRSATNSTAVETDGKSIAEVTNM